ncbi:MAG TPA: hypothetical protein VMS75_00870 [Terriglobales bacterium]|nr:hypothetical protein [Terriglobales bacterium]
MLKTNVFPLTARLAGLRLRSSRLVPAVAAALPVFLLGLGLKESPATALKVFLLFFPYIFLLASQDMSASETQGGGLENVLFLDGRFRTYLWQKNLVLAAAGGVYACAVFVGLAAWHLGRGTFEPASVLQLGLGLLAGAYYVAVAGALGFVLRAGSNVVVLLLAQAAALIGLILSTTLRTGFIDHLASGRFPGFGSKLLFAGLAAVFPNLIVARRLSRGGAVVLAGLVLALLVQRARLRRLELTK